MKHIILVLLLLVAGPVWAVQPDEVLKDPVLEARARALSQDLRCVVCRGENIDESNAGIARDIRILLRERLTAGDSDKQVMDFMVSRYGEYVLMKPTTKGANILLWIAAPLMLFGGLVIALVYVRRRNREGGDAVVELTPVEEKRLHELMGR